MKTAFERFPLLPLVVGITGHRDLLAEDLPFLKEALRGKLKKLQDDYPNSPVLVLCALAEGADRLAAEVALELGCRLGAVLPMPEAEYQRDFEAEESCREFASLVSRASWVHVVASPETYSATDANQRNLCYLNAGIWMIHHAQVLVAFWDGVENGKPGGTADIVRLARTGIPSGDAGNIVIPDIAPVYQVWSRRTSNFSVVPESRLGQVEWLPPAPDDLPPETDEQRWLNVLRHIDQFNGDVQRYAEVRPGGIERHAAYLQEHLPSTSFLGRALETQRICAAADAISSETQLSRDRAFWWILGAALLAVFFEQIYSGPDLRPLWIFLAILAGCGGWWVYRFVGSRRLEEKYLDYRALAEALRVQFYWQVGGVNECAADHYLRDQRDELEWVRRALRSQTLPSANREDELPISERQEGVRRGWLEGQRAYFVRKAAEQERRLEQGERRALWLFRGGLAAIVAAFLYNYVIMSLLPEVGDSALQWIIVTYGMLFALAALVEVNLSIKAYKEQSNRYRKMGLYYTLAASRMEEALSSGDHVRARDILIEIGKIALAENGDWLILHRQRPVEVPIG